MQFDYGSKGTLTIYYYWLERTNWMYQTKAKIEGMMCNMCEAHIAEAIRKAVPSAKKVKADRRKKQATFLTEEKADLDALEAAIQETGYDYLGAECLPCQKKGLFGRF